MIVFDDGAIYCIDPFNASEVLTYLGDKTLSGIINTHDHCDHYSGNDVLVDKFKCPVYSHEVALVRGKTHSLKDHEVVYQFGSWTLETIYTPGHTLSHICLLLKKDGSPHSIFTGDCFFNAGVGNCHNGGNPEVLYKTISEIFSTYPDELLIYPGHEYLKRNLEFTMSVENSNEEAQNFLNKIATIDLNEVFFINSMQTERKINSFLRLKSLKLKGTEKEVFLKLRELRNRW
ncbi:MAG: MBL fold metallo-hydrolase [Bdellovibrionales bacterium]|nr:MBL fold metallo-hydrolase [Bdellovibrionales bacterium]